MEKSLIILCLFCYNKSRNTCKKFNIVEQSGKIIQYSLVNKKYTISDVFKNHDEYISTAFPELKINLKDIFE